jgi:hypothetical protein
MQRQNAPELEYSGPTRTEPRLIADGGTAEIPPSSGRPAEERLREVIKQLRIVREDVPAASEDLADPLAEIRAVRERIMAEDGREAKADGGHYDCYDCGREISVRHSVRRTIVEHHDEGLGYDEFEVPLCRGCAAERFGERCDECGETFLDVDHYNEHYAREHMDGGRLIPDGGAPQCTIMECSGEAEFAYWMPDIGDFSRVRNPEHYLLDDGDLSPYVCEACRDRLGDSPHYDSERFVRPEEKLVADGGEPLITAECPDCCERYDPENESTADHDPDCPVRVGLINTGRWEDPSETGGKS